MCFPIDTTCTLIEALERSSSEEEWRKLLSLDDECLKRGLILEHFGAGVINLSGRAVADEDIWRQRREILNELEVKLRRRLESGEWVATGFKSPVDSEDALPVTVQPESWRTLTHLSYTNSATTGGELRFVGLRIKESKAEQSSVPNFTDQTSKRTAKNPRVVPELEAALVSRIKDRSSLAQGRRIRTRRGIRRPILFRRNSPKINPERGWLGTPPPPVRQIIELGNYPPMKKRKIAGLLKRRIDDE